MKLNSCILAAFVALPVVAAFSTMPFKVSTSVAGKSSLISERPLQAFAQLPLRAGRMVDPCVSSLQMAAKGVTKVSVGLVGTGVVGGELFKQLEATKAKLLKDDKIDMTLAAVSTVKDDASWMLCDDKGISMKSFEGALAAKGTGQAGDFKAMAEFLLKSSKNAIIVDCTASEAVSEMYLPWLKMGCHVCTPNKKVGSGPLQRYKDCKKAMEEVGSQWGYETTVGAGLPIIGTTKTDLLATGDKVKKIEGIFSGTLSYIFNTYKPGMAFSDVIEDAKNKGFTEPDPRDDLSGTDVARKVVILARECGMDVELSDVPVDSLVPKSLQAWQPPAGVKTADAFIKEMKAFDAEKAELIKKATEKGMVLRFVGVVDLENKKAKVTLAEYPNTHPFAGTQYADNICAFSTERYVPQPLVIQGPGAGAAVTAAGVYADMIRIAKTLN